MIIPLVTIHCLGFLSADDHLCRTNANKVGQAEILYLKTSVCVLCVHACARVCVLTIYFERVLLHGEARCWLGRYVCSCFLRCESTGWQRERAREREQKLATCDVSLPNEARQDWLMLINDLRCQSHRGRLAYSENSMTGSEGNPH